MRLPTLGIGLAGLLFIGSMMPASAIIPEADGPATSALIKKLSKTKTADAAVQGLVDRQDTETALQIASDESADIVARGYAIVALSKMRTSDEALQSLANSSDPLISTYAWAARITAASDLDTLAELANNVRGRPALQRPISERANALFAKDNPSTASLISLSQTMPQLAGSVIDNANPKAVVAVMFEGRDDRIRRQAAAIAASMATQKGQADVIAKATLEQLTPKPKAARPPWDGGALFVPGLNWDRAEAKELVSSLTAWGIIAHSKQWTNDLRPIQNNLNSISLLNQAGVGRTFANSQSEMESLHETVAGASSLKALKSKL